MKKILTASLVAMMAVTAANADIASTAYVDKAKQAAEATATGYNTAMNTRVTSLEGDNTTNKSDISQLKKDVAAIGGDGGSISTQIAAAVDGLDVGEIAVADGKYVKTVSETDGKVSVTTADLVTQISGDAESSLVAPTTAAVTGYVVNKLNAMSEGVSKDMAAALVTVNQNIGDLQQDKADKTALAATDAKVAANTGAITKLNGDANTAGSVAKAVADAKSDLQDKIDAINNADTGVLKTAQTYADTKVSELAAGAVKTNADAIAAEKSAREAADTQLQGKIDAINNAETGALKQAKDYTDALANGAVAANTGAITKLNGDANTAGSVAKAVADAQAAAATDAASKANKALEDAKADATSKANQALADAKADATSKIEALDKADTAVAGSYVSAVSEENGVISVSRASLTPVAKMDVPADCATKLCALVYDKEKSTAGNPVLKWEVIAE